MDDWLAQTKKLQETSFGRDFEAFSEEDRLRYIKDMVLALTDELHEALNEVSWKPWQADRFINRAEYIKELVDAGHFLANLLVAVSCTDEEYWTAYRQKMEVNRERQARKDGYVSAAGITKCSQCRRSFDDVGESEAIDGYCLKCETDAMRERGF